MTERANELKYRPAEDFLKDAEECSIVEDVFRELEEEDSKTVLDEDRLRRQEDWSVLASQVVGSESTSSRR